MKIHPCIWPPDQLETLCQISVHKSREMEKNLKLPFMIRQKKAASIC